MSDTTSFIIENDFEFRRALDRLGKSINDFRIPFGLIALNWYKGNRQIFTLKGPGKYTDFQGPRDETSRSRSQHVYRAQHGDVCGVA